MSFKFRVEFDDPVFWLINNGVAQNRVIYLHSFK